MRILEHVVTRDQENRTVKSIALKEMRLSRGQFSSLKFSGGITVDGQPSRADVRLRAGQRLRATLREEGSPALIPYDLPVRIVYEDADYWVIDKPAPLPTLCSARQEGPTLENALYAFLGCPPDFVFRPVNRLDKGTSGLLCVARNAHAQQLLQRLLHTDQFVREYRAVCRGRLTDAEGVLDLPIAKAGDGVRRCVSPEGRRAVTHYRVEETGPDYSLVRLRLETGRTHQIRVHMAAAGCPLIGDYLYGQPDPRLPGRFALHACAVRFLHPLTGREISLSSVLPPEMLALCGKNEETVNSALPLPPEPRRG